MPYLRRMALLVLLCLVLTACGTADASPTPEAATANEKILISAPELAVIKSDPNLRVVDFGGAAAFTEGHIPGATNLDWGQFNLGDTGDAATSTWQESVQQLLGQSGISADNRVVIYDHGDMFGARLWWVLDQLGHPNKQILDGGFMAWQQAGEATSTDPATYQPTTYSGTPRPELLATADEVLAALGKPEVALVDARSTGEYNAKSSGTTRGGHIPGAVNIPYDTVVQDGYFNPAAGLKAQFAEQGITPDKQVITYCSTGVRAAVDYVALRLAGFENVQVYTGSWAEWGPRADLPVDENE